MSIGVLHGQTGLDNLNFRVIGSTTEPSNPKENDIWIKTSFPIPKNSVFFNELVPVFWLEAGDGAIYIPYEASNSSKYTSTGLNVTGRKGFFSEFNANLLGCQQLINREWKHLYAYIYHSGTWVQFSSESVIPTFTYTGNYEIVNDADEPITTSQGNWKIRFLTSGTLTFHNLGGAQNGIDVFLVGGGGGGGAANGNAYHGGSGGGGGYVSTQKNVSITAGTSYPIVIGAGGSAASASNGGSGGETKAFGYSASGGSGGRTGVASEGGSGGSGGGGGSRYSTGGTGGSNGSAGSMAGGSDERGAGGSGSGITTREFGDSSGRLYSGGGGGGSGYSVDNLSSGGNGGGGAGGSRTIQPIQGTANTGGGGGGSGCSSDNASGAAGGSGIVVIRNKR